jgi:hypothetical protein
MPDVSVKAAETEYKMLMRNYEREDCPPAERAYLANSISFVKSYLEAARHKVVPKYRKRRYSDDED